MSLYCDFNTSITFISAYGAGGEKPNTIDWKSFAKTSQLDVVYMGLERIYWVCKELVLQGRDEKENDGSSKPYFMSNTLCSLIGKKNKGQKMTKEGAMAKFYASEVAVKVANEAVQIFGGYGYTKDFPVEKFYRDAKLCTIGEGTSEIQKLVISKSILNT